MFVRLRRAGARAIFVEPTLRALMLVSLFMGFAMAMRVDYVGIWLVRELHAPAGALGLAYMGNAAFEVGATVLAGRLCDRFGRRPVLVAGALGTMSVALLLPLVGGHLLAGLLLLAAGGAADAVAWVALSVAVSYAVEEKRLERAYATRQIVNSIAYVLGPLTASLVFSFGWDWIWRLSGCAAFAAAVIACRWRPTTAQQARPPADVGSSGGRRSSFIFTSVFLWLFVGTAFTYLLFFMYEISLPVVLAGGGTLTPQTAGFLYAVNPVVVILFQRLMTGRVSRLSDRAKLLLGTALMTLPSLGLLTGSVRVFFMVLAFVALGETIWGPISAAVAVRYAPVDARGSFIAALSTSYSLGIGLAPALGFQLYRLWESAGLAIGIFLAGVVGGLGYAMGTRGRSSFRGSSFAAPDSPHPSSI